MFEFKYYNDPKTTYKILIITRKIDNCLEVHYQMSPKNSLNEMVKSLWNRYYGKECSYILDSEDYVEFLNNVLNSEETIYPENTFMFKFSDMCITYIFEKFGYIHRTEIITYNQYESIKGLIDNDFAVAPMADDKLLFAFKELPDEKVRTILNLL